LQGSRSLGLELRNFVQSLPCLAVSEVVDMSLGEPQPPVDLPFAVSALDLALQGDSRQAMPQCSLRWAIPHLSARCKRFQATVSLSPLSETVPKSAMPPAHSYSTYEIGVGLDAWGGRSHFGQATVANSNTSVASAHHFGSAIHRFQPQASC